MYERGWRGFLEGGIVKSGCLTLASFSSDVSVKSPGWANLQVGQKGRFRRRSIRHCTIVWKFWNRADPEDPADEIS